MISINVPKNMKTIIAYAEAMVGYLHTHSNTCKLCLLMLPTQNITVIASYYSL